MTSIDLGKLNAAIRSLLATQDVDESLAAALHECPDFDHMIKGFVLVAIEEAGYKFDPKGEQDMDHPFVLTLHMLCTMHSSSVHAGVKIGYAAAKAGLVL